MNPNFLKVFHKRFKDSKTKYHRPFSGPRRTFLGIHLYRKTVGLRWDINKLLCRKPGPWKGVSIEEWEQKITKLVPWQFWWRSEFLCDLEDNFKFFEVYYQDWLPDDKQNWSWMDYLSAIELNHSNRILKAIRHFKIEQVDDRLHPHNVVKIKTIDRHYRDTDSIMLHAIFQIFCDFYDRKGDQRANYPIQIYGDVDVNKVWREWAEEAHEVYQWWKNRDAIYLLWQDKYDALDTTKEDWHIKYSEVERAQSQETEDYLVRVIKLRQGLLD